MMIIFVVSFKLIQQINQLMEAIYILCDAIFSRQNDAISCWILSLPELCCLSYKVIIEVLINLDF